MLSLDVSPAHVKHSAGINNTCVVSRSPVEEVIIKCAWHPTNVDALTYRKEWVHETVSNPPPCGHSDNDWRSCHYFTWRLTPDYRQLAAGGRRGAASEVQLVIGNQTLVTSPNTPGHRLVRTGVWHPMYLVSYIFLQSCSHIQYLISSLYVIRCKQQWVISHKKLGLKNIS